MNLTRTGTFPAKGFSTRGVAASAVSLCLWVGLGLSILTGAVRAQTSAKVDFEREVLPLFRENCLDCHGPSKQKAGLRLDRRSSVIKSFARRVVPGSSANSMVYHRLAGTEFGMQMPPKGALSPEHVALVKAWID